MKTNKDKCPYVSIIIPCRNEEFFIQRCLNSVLVQDYPSDCLEIIVVDGLSEDNTRTIIQEMIHQQQTIVSCHSSETNTLSPRLILLDNPRRIVPTALNIGLKNAQGDVIFRLDGHSEMASNYVRTCISKLVELPEVACIGGPSVAVGTGVIGTAYALALQSAFGVGGRHFVRSEPNEWWIPLLSEDIGERYSHIWVDSIPSCSGIKTSTLTLPYAKPVTSN